MYLQSALKLLRDLKYFLVKFYKDDVTYQGTPRGLSYRESKMLEKGENNGLLFTASDL